MRPTPSAAALSSEVVVFGLGETASLAWYALSHDSPWRVTAFTVDALFMAVTELHGLPVLPFDSLPGICPPDRCHLHLPIGWKEMNGLRRRQMVAARAMGYQFVSYVATGTRLWASTVLGANAIVQRGAVIEPFARIGDGCCIYQRAVIGLDAVLGDCCYVASDAVVGPGAEIGEGCVLGLGCTIAEGVKVGPGCFVGAGAVVTEDAAGNGVYLGIPARRQTTPADRLAATG